MKLQVQDKDLIQLALREDTCRGDPTTASLIDRGKTARALIFARSQGIISGLYLAKTVFKTLDPRVKFRLLVPEGSLVKVDTAVADIKGKARSLFKGERLALNFIQHLSGISTTTFQFVIKAKNTSIKITDTRKTIPGLRHLEKYAVRMGGGVNHRTTLGDFILIKDNHWRFLPEDSLAEGVKRIRKRKPELEIEVEVKKIPELKKALEAEVDVILLDNMDYALLKKSVKLIENWRKVKKRRRPLIEVSGGINPDNFNQLIPLRIDRVSIGALTHSAPAFPADMEIINE